MATMNIKAEEIREYKADLQAGIITKKQYETYTKQVIKSHINHIKGIVVSAEFWQKECASLL